MREILFRGKAINRNKSYYKTPYNDGEWVYGLVTRLYEEHFEKLPMLMTDIYGIKDIEIDRNTLSQYTGLKDKNGIKIFEGDYIVCRQEIQSNHIDAIIEMGYVEFKYGAYGLHRKQGFYRPFKDWLEDYEYEVIGNIYDNPEFLNVTIMQNYFIV